MRVREDVSECPILVVVLDTQTILIHFALFLSHPIHPCAIHNSSASRPLPHTLRHNNPINQLIIRRHRHLPQRPRLHPQPFLLRLWVRCAFGGREREHLFR